jgi:hypothetical protein
LLSTALEMTFVPALSTGPRAHPTDFTPGERDHTETTPQVTFSERGRGTRTRDVAMYVTDDTREHGRWVPGVAHLGTDGFVVELEGGEIRKEILMVPSTQLTTRENQGTVLEIHAGWPTWHMDLEFRSESEALRFKDEVDAISYNLVLSVHLTATPRDMQFTALEPPVDRSIGGFETLPFLCGAYVIRTFPRVDVMAHMQPRAFLCWAELRGPGGPRGKNVQVQFFNNHTEDGLLTFEFFWPDPADKRRKDTGHRQVAKNGRTIVVTKGSASWAMHFRAASEADFWWEVANEARGYKSGTLPQARKEQVKKVRDPILKAMGNVDRKPLLRQEDLTICSVYIPPAIDDMAVRGIAREKERKERIANAVQQQPSKEELRSMQEYLNANRQNTSGFDTTEIVGIDTTEIVDN